MYVDASVIVAILNREHDAEHYKAILDRNLQTGLISPVTIYEAAISLARAKALLRGQKPTKEEIQAAFKSVHFFMTANGIKEITIDTLIGKGAVEAAAIYGKVVGHPADLNFGDCFAYACAKAHNVSLLFKGNDFAKTDLAVEV